MVISKPDNALTMSEASKMYGVTIRTLQNWLNKGLISGVKTTNKRVYLDKNSIEGYLNGLAKA